MQLSRFNVQVPLPDRNEVFLMNTFSDAQLLASPDVATLLDRIARGESSFDAEERETIDALRDNGFIVESRENERVALDQYFHNLREDTEQVRVTVLTTLQCNFACDYCFQGDHGDYNKFAEKMSLETAAKVAEWIAGRLDEVRPGRFVLTLFGGEPLLNLPVAYFLAERCHRECETRGVRQAISLITNGLLLTPEVVDRLTPYGLSGVKITLDGDRETHNRMRPLRGRQGTFDRIIENVRRVANKVPITIGGNFDESSADSFPALLDYLREQEFAGKIVKVNFKPVIKSFDQPAAASPSYVASGSSRSYVASGSPSYVASGFSRTSVIPLTLVSGDGKPLNGTCMTSAGAGRLAPATASSVCDSCHFVDEKMAFLRSETRRRGFPTPDGVHMGPCEIHRRHAYTLGPDGSIYACPGFTGSKTDSTGHIDGRVEEWRRAAAVRFERLSPRKDECGECSFVPVCGGGCSVAAHTELGDMHQPSCHKGALEAAVVSLA
ncbi:MAG: radical SAM protein, partial [Acidobacteria bacterium]|nr:radical SAM protein [Acidobacteriota bacterium]